ncbi:MAG: anthranilate 1,2-dioxygenase regulatory protein AndR [Burkholderiaceae bacterium]
MRTAIAAPTAAAYRPGLFEPGLLRSNRLFESNDLDDTRERISRVMQPHNLKPLARPTGRLSHMDFMRVGGIGFGAIDFGEAMRVDVEHIEDYHLLMFCLRGSAQTLAGSEPVAADGSHGMICAPGSRFVADLSPDCEQFVVRLDRAVVEAHAGRPIRFHESLDLRRPELRAWLDQLGLLLTSSAMMQTVRDHPLIAMEMERLLVHLLLQGQGWTEAPGASSATAHSPTVSRACVRRAEAFMQAHAEDALRLADIARAAGVPVRTLLDAFRRVRECSPMQFLREMRLEMARRRLGEPDAQETVASIAMDCGFAHLGRFAQAYRERFGEAPSVTLRNRG